MTAKAGRRREEDTVNYDSLREANLILGFLESQLMKIHYYIGLYGYAREKFIV